VIRHREHRAAVAHQRRRELRHAHERMARHIHGDGEPIRRAVEQASLEVVHRTERNRVQQCDVRFGIGADDARQMHRTVGERDCELGLAPITPADISDAAVGDAVLAAGNPLGVGQTVTQGIVSAIVRKGMNPVENFIQTDAAINPGNSGCALIDTAGRLVGIKGAIPSHSGGSKGIGFRHPGGLRANGLSRRNVAGDIIIWVGERPITHAQDVRSVVIGAEPGAHVPTEIVRNGKGEAVDVELAAIPPAISSLIRSADRSLVTT
jgi:hypothetical protein